MKNKIIGILGAAVLFGPAIGLAAGGGGMQLLSASVDPSDKASLQRGAKTYVNYCLGCHSIDYLRYNRLAKDLDLTDKQVAENLLFTSDKVVDEMNIAMRKDDAKRWFGVVPPDLSLVARSRGANWLYSYLATFYKDDNPSRPFGVNNIVFRDVGMPHVLWPMQGVPELVKAERPANATGEQIIRLSASAEGVDVAVSVTTKDADDNIGHETVVDKLVLMDSMGTMPGEFRRDVRDLVNFLAYASEPSKESRMALGPWVIGFLIIFSLLAFALKKEYWKDVH